MDKHLLADHQMSIWNAIGVNSSVNEVKVWVASRLQ